MILQNNISLRVCNFIYKLINMNFNQQSQLTIVYLLLLSKTCLLSRRKIYESVKNFMSIMFSKLIIWNRKVLLIKVCSLKICMFFIVFLHRRNKNFSIIFFFKDISNCFCSEKIRKRNNRFDKVKKKTAKTYFEKSKTSIVM